MHVGAIDMDLDELISDAEQRFVGGPGSLLDDMIVDRISNPTRAGNNNRT